MVSVKRTTTPNILDIKAIWSLTLNNSSLKSEIIPTSVQSARLFIQGAKKMFHIVREIILKTGTFHL